MRLKEYRTLLFGSILILSNLAGNRVSASDRNLLFNPGAEEKYAFSGWTAIGSQWGKNGWNHDFYIPHSGQHHWTGCPYPSGVPTLLIQTIDLIGLGYDSLLLDSSPMISAGAYVCNNAQSPRLVLIKIELIDKNDSVFRTEYAANEPLDIPSWKLIYSTISGYGTGLRKIRFTMGNDGNSTIHLDDAFVYIVDKIKALTDDVTDITSISAQFNGFVYPDNKNTEVFFEYDTTTVFTNRVPADPALISGDSAVIVNAHVFLQPAKTYFVRAVAINESDTSYGEIYCFKTSKAILSPSGNVLPIADTAGSIINISILPTLKWQASVDVSWLSLSQDPLAESGLNVVVTEPNPSELPRKALLKLLLEDTVEIVVRISQIKSSIYLSPQSLEVGADTNTYKIKIKSELACSATPDVPWLIVNSDSVEANGLLILKVMDNENDVERNGMIILSSNSDTATLFVKQIILNGKGTIGEPFLISNYNELGLINKNLNAHYRLINNISAPPYTSYLFPIAKKSEQYFQGSLDGNGFVISHVRGALAGLFAKIKNASIINLGIINCEVSRSTGVNYTGGIVGKAINSVIQNCFVSGNLDSWEETGGIAGILENSIISDCYSAGIFKSKRCGGIVGSSYSSQILNCYTTAILSGSVETGGIAGKNYNSTIRNCYVAGKFDCLNSGAIVSYNDSGYISNSYYDADFTVPSNGDYGIPLKNPDMKKSSTFSFWDFENKWKMRNDTTLPGLSSLNNAPFAFNDTVEITGYTQMNQVLKNDYDIETTQNDLVFKFLKLTGIGTYSNTWFNFPNSTANGTISVLSYAVGEVLSSGDILWGSTALAFLKKVPNDSPVAYDDTFYTTQATTIPIPRSFIVANDSDANENLILVTDIGTPRHGTLLSIVDYVLYTPDRDWFGIDSINYYVTDGFDLDSAVLKIFVRKKPEITWDNPADISYGNALSTVELSAFSDVQGSFMYDPVSGSMLNAGSDQNLSVLFIPDNPDLYLLAKDSVTINVTKAELKITADDKAIYQGDALPEFTLQYEGFVYGDSFEDLDELPVISTLAVPSDPPGSYDILLTGGSDNNYHYVLVNGVLKIEINTGLNIPDHNIRIYPIPSKDHINIQLKDSGKVGYEISSVEGTIIQKGVLTGERINLSNLKAGIYLLGIEHEGTVDHFKIVKE